MAAVAPGRYGGLRCPSGHLALRWVDIDWEHSRMTVRSPKTEHHEGKASRLVPIFPELYPDPREAFEAAEPGSEYVITRCREGGVNLRTQLERIIRWAGLQPWPKLFHNLRASRETELAERFPLHVVCAWIGDSQPVAAKHYLQVTEEHFNRAIAGDRDEREKAAQSPAQQPHAEAREASQTPKGLNAQLEELRAVATVCNCPQDSAIPPRGVEPLSSG